MADPYGDGGPPPGSGQPWWQGPPPPGLPSNLPWPPPLPPGGSYGPNPGQVIYPTDANGQPTTNTPAFPIPGTTTPTPTPTTTPPAPTGGGTPPPAAATDYDFNQARANIERAIGRPLSDADVSTAFQMFGGNAQSRFTDASIAPVIAHFKGATTPPQTTTSGPGAPTFNGPGYTPPPAFNAPPAFSYADFAAPDPNDLQNDPWTKYTLKNEQDTIQKGAAARGVLNTGGTINDLLVNAADVNSQGYQGIWNRKKSEYDTNRGNAFDTYKTNYGIGKDVYDTNTQNQYKDPFQFGYQGALDAFNSKIHNFDQNQYYAQHNADQTLATNTHNADQNRQYDWYKTLFQYQQGEDEWARKFRLLGLMQ